MTKRALRWSAFLVAFLTTLLTISHVESWLKPKHEAPLVAFMSHEEILSLAEYIRTGPKEKFFYREEYSDSVETFYKAGFQCGLNTYDVIYSLDRNKEPYLLWIMQSRRGFEPEHFKDYGLNGIVEEGADYREVGSYRFKLANAFDPERYGNENRHRWQEKYMWSLVCINRQRTPLPPLR